MDSTIKNTKSTFKDGLSTRIKTDINDNPENIEEYIILLGEHQKLFQKNGKFIEAERTKKKGLQLKTQLEEKFLKDMKNDHQNQKQEIDKAHEQQMASFSLMKTDKMNAYKQQMKAKEDELIKRHENDLRAYEDELEKTYPLKVKQSPQLINMRKILDILAKQQNYKEAHQVQLKIQTLQKQQNPKFAQDRLKKLSNLVYQFKQKQACQTKALQQKLKLGFDQKKKMFTIQENKLKQKYQNTRSELQFNHKLELRKFQKQRKLHKDKLTLSRSYLCFSK